LIADDSGLEADQEGQYYIDVRDLQPGEIIHKRLTIRNLDRDTPFDLGLTAEEVSWSGPIDLLREVQLTLSLEGQVVYQGRLAGDEGPGMVDRPLSLGTYATGDQRTLDVVLAAPADLPVGPVASAADFRWRFYATRAEGSVPPRTGESDTRTIKYALVLGTVVLTALGVAARRRAEVTR
jgi:hypothetical protein